jgi:5,10-methenyltetrahydromethanopterin hydrogenase
LSLPEDVYKANLKAERQQMTIHMRSYITEESHAKRRKPRTKAILPVPVILPAPIIQNIIGLDPDKVISFLIDENVEPDTIVKMIAHLEISSGTLMAELCKYMTKKTLEKQATWRPTGYNTAEAQMSIKI